VRIIDRRPGDPAVLVSSADAIRADLGWRAQRDLRSMVADAWTFTQLLAKTG
jgi:UDP-glucose 4-epimerase